MAAGKRKAAWSAVPLPASAGFYWSADRHGSLRVVTALNGPDVPDAQKAREVTVTFRPQDLDHLAKILAIAIARRDGKAG